LENTDDENQEVHCHEEVAPQEPKRKRHKTQDVTIEKLGELFMENPQGLLLYRDELPGWLYSFEKNGHENDREFYLECWGGKGDYDVDRIGRGLFQFLRFVCPFLGLYSRGLYQNISAMLSKEDWMTMDLFKDFKLWFGQNLKARGNWYKAFLFLS